MKKVFMLAAVLVWSASCTVTVPIAATSNPVGTKTGTSTARRILGIWVQQDASVVTAAKNGGITKISTVDKTTRHGLFVFKIETKVTGE